jgi:endonuclease VIII
MPEGDTIHYAAKRIGAVLTGHVPDELLTPHPRFGHDRWPERLAGRAVRSVDAHGKHLFLRFDGGLVIHSHLRMTGTWRVRPAGEAVPPTAWLVIRRGDRAVLQLRGPVLELMTESRTRFDQRLAGLGPDILAPELDETRFLRRLRQDDPTRAIADALLDQRTIAGIGNLWKCEGCFAAGIDPWRPVGRVSDDEALAIVRLTRPRMQQSAADGMQDKQRRVYGLAGRPCPRCGGRIKVRGQGDDNRSTFWCPTCQH